MAAMHGAARFATNVASVDNCCAGGNPSTTRKLHLKSAFRGNSLILPQSSKPQKGDRFQQSRIVASSPVVVETPTQVASRVNPLTKNDLVAHLESGCRPKKAWRIGTEHEKFGFQLDTLEPMSFEHISQILEGIKSRFNGYEAVMEGENIIGLKKDGLSISLEPGGQFELSGAPVVSVHETSAEVNRHLYEVKSVAEDLGLGFAGMGFDPKWPLEARPHMPKTRYEGVDSYVLRMSGKPGMDVMYRTCTAQVNLDFGSEKDMINKLRVGLSLQPIATALFASSPFTEGKPNGYLSHRGYLWTKFNKDRSGQMPFVFEDDFGFEKFTEYALNVPMYMVYRNNEWKNCTGESFKDFMAGKLWNLPGVRPSLNDWENHLGTIYTEVRLKRFLEMRGADCGPLPFINALPAFWTGLLYDEESLNDALDITRDWTNKEREMLREEVPRHGLQVPFREGLLKHVAQDILKIAKDGLSRRGFNETVFLDPIEEVATTGVTLAERLLNAYEGKWARNIDPIFDELRL